MIHIWQNIQDSNIAGNTQGGWYPMPIKKGGSLARNTRVWTSSSNYIAKATDREVFTLTGYNFTPDNQYDNDGSAYVLVQKPIPLGLIWARVFLRREVDDVDLEDIRVNEYLRQIEVIRYFPSTFPSGGTDPKPSFPSNIKFQVYNQADAHWRDFLVGNTTSAWRANITDPLDSNIIHRIRRAPYTSADETNVKVLHYTLTSADSNGYQYYRASYYPNPRKVQIRYIIT